MELTDIVANLDRRLAEAQAQITHLEGARKALVDGSPAAPVSHPTPVSHRRRPRSRAGAPVRQVVSGANVMSVLAGSEGMTTRALADATYGRPMQVLRLLRQLEAAGEVRRSGVRRSTRWHVVTDEDRIAERAAQLAAQSKRARARRT